MGRARICILTETFYPLVGGGETQARALAEGLAERGFGVSVVTRRSDATFEEFECLGSIRIHRLRPIGSGHLKKWGLLCTGLLGLIRLRREYDLLFVSGFRVLGVPAVLASKLFARTCILKADSLGEMSGEFFHRGLHELGLGPAFWPFRVFLSLRNRLLKQCNRFVAISSALEEELVVQGVDPAAIERIPNGIDVGRFSPPTPAEKMRLRERFRIPGTARVVIFTGRLVSYKGLPLLLRVWKGLHLEHADARLLIVGTGGLDIDNCEEELRSYVEENDLQKSVRFVGAVDHVHEYLRASDVFVFPTEQEAFGISLVEAMACGLPAIATSVGGVAEILDQGKDGRIVEAGSYGQLSDALRNLLSDRSGASALGRRARRAAEARYAMEIVLGRYVDLFDSFE